MFLLRAVSGSIQSIVLWPIITSIYCEPKYRGLYYQQLWHITEEQ